MLEKGPLDDEEQTYLMNLAAVAGGRAKVLREEDESKSRHRGATWPRPAHDARGGERHH